MCRPKEPNFFSDDENYSRGWGWYEAMFRPAAPEDLRGESSTHYTKLPSYRRTVDRMVHDLPRLKFIYVMRHPIDRVMSQYVHELTARVVHFHPGLRERPEWNETAYVI